MRVVVAGATGRIGSRTVARLRDHGVEVVLVSRGGGVDVTTGEGLTRALRGADVVVDVTDAPSRGQLASLEFFGTATGNLLEAAASAGVEHHVVLSVVGAERLRAGYFRAKALQEEQVRRSPIPHSVVRATPFFESVEYMSRPATYGDVVHVAPVLTRPVSADDVAAAIAHVAVGVPLFGTLEVAGPEEHRLDDLTAKLLAARGDMREVVADTHAPFFGAEVGERTLLPAPDAHLGHETFAQWLARR
ncbi:NAD(P)H-binding protein [Streptomyces sp. DG2A-72]|uniref:SDR family oxidoreductase n=1 Tax=Streptomyces sp. DG2A-72 TaxID=3051386 RepID=UPI00265BB991|nr:NAD(P)H-binding protein [Streptomyces sp. DG2A-72]MDO0930503.1 NAD(P)H-binding protein [Streptomyces sp. DG2A-72]